MAVSEKPDLLNIALLNLGIFGMSVVFLEILQDFWPHL